MLKASNSAAIVECIEWTAGDFVSISSDADAAAVVVAVFQSVTIVCRCDSDELVSEYHARLKKQGRAPTVRQEHARNRVRDLTPLDINRRAINVGRLVEFDGGVASVEATVGDHVVLNDVSGAFKLDHQFAVPAAECAGLDVHHERETCGFSNGN